MSGKELGERRGGGTTLPLAVHSGTQFVVTGKHGMAPFLKIMLHQNTAGMDFLLGAVD